VHKETYDGLHGAVNTLSLRNVLIGERGRPARSSARASRRTSRGHRNWSNTLPACPRANGEGAVGGARGGRAPHPRAETARELAAETAALPV